LLALIPVFDALLNQLSTADILLGPLSVLQALRGAEIVLLLILGIWAIAYRPRIDRAFVGLSVASVAAAACILLSEVRNYGSMEFGSLIGVVQLAYVFILWLAVSTLARKPEDCRTVLVGIAVGALISAISVLITFIRQDRITAAYGGVVATSGLFFSAKYLIGGWIVGGFIWMYLPLRRFHALGIAAAGLCFLALFATYNRTGQLCLAASVAWACYWYWRHAERGPETRWARQLLILSAISVVAFLLFVGTTDIAQRWSDLADRDTAGSGRLLLWTVATMWALDTSPANLLSGTGFRGMYDVMETATGLRIHTHSDIFDMLMISGVIGLVMYLLLVRNFHRIVQRQLRSSSAHAIGVTALVTFLLSSALTGQITQPTAMTTYILAILCTLPLSATTSRHQALPGR